MKKKSITGLSEMKTESQRPVEAWHNGGDIEILQYVRSLQNAAKILVGKLDVERSATTEWDICPAVLLYRQALEIHLKMLVGEGSNFLEKRTDPISLSTTHSLRWLAQIVCQIIRKVGWESEFRCAGVFSLAEFSTLVNDLEEMNPVACAVRSNTRRRDGSVPHQLEPPNVLKFAIKLDALLELLDSTADGLAAEWDMRSNFGGGDFGQTIQ